MSYKKDSRRCRNFNDDGDPIGRGCMRTNCQFLHPTDPSWAQAQPSRRRNSDVNSNPSHLPDSGWGSRSGGPSFKTPSTTKDWDTSVWDSPSKKKTGDNSTSRNWGSQSSGKKDATAASPTSTSVSNGWNMTTDEGGESSKSGTEGGWGNTDLPATWGVDITSTWGGGDTGEGWGGGGGNDGWGGGKTADNTNTSWNDQKGKKKEKEREDVEMSDPLPPKTAVGSLKPVSLSHTKPDSAPPPLPPARNTTPPSTVASKPARPIPLPLSLKQKAKLYEDGNLTKLALLSVKNKEAEQVQEKQNSPSFHGPKGRADLFSQVLKQTSTVVILQVELQHAQRDLARWKRTQESAQYERASHTTRIILDRNRAIFNYRAQEAKRRLDRALSALIDLPDFVSRNRKTAIPMLTKETIAAYTAELKDWFADIEQHKRILMEREKERADLLPAVEDTSVEPQLTARQLLERDQWTWNEIRNATNELDTRILTASEHLYSDVYTTISDFKEQAAGLQDPRPISLTTTATTQGTQSEAASSTANVVGDNLSTQATRAAELISKIHALEQEHDHLENEIRSLNKFCAEAEVHVSQFAQWKQNDEAKIQQMKEQLWTLHLHHKSPTKTSSSIPPAQLDGMILQLRPVVIDHLQKEVQPIFDAFRSRCLENLEGSKNLIEELVTPALVMTDDICHRVSTLSCDEIMDSK